MENEELQTTFNTDPIGVLVEEGEIENINNEQLPDGIGAEDKFTVRTTKPGAGNGFYIRRATGGMNNCIQGKPTDANCNVLSNCVGYANGRFNEVYSEIKHTYEMPYQITTNAENWIEKAQALGLQIVDHPVAGSVLCMKKGKTLSGSDGAGHVIFVERVIDNNTIYTSESAYGGSAFYNVTRTNNNGRWGMGSDYSFRGFIVNPALPEEPTPTPTPTPTDVTYIVNANSGLWLLNDNKGKIKAYSKGTEVTYLNEGYDAYGYHYLHVRVNKDGNVGYMASQYLTKVDPTPAPTPTDEIKEGDWVEPIILIDYKGTPLKQYDKSYKVTELVGDRAVCSALRNGEFVVWAAMNVKNLRKI